MNVTFKDGKLIITVDASATACQAAKPSQTGKTRILASTHGFTKVVGGPDGLGLSLNVTLPAATLGPQA